MSARPGTDEYSPSHAPYVEHVKDETDIVATLRRQRDQLAALGREVTGERERFRYAEGKWSIRELVGHLADGERIFGYRACCVARGDQQPLPPFDEQLYGANMNADRRELADLLAELLHLRDANLLMFASLDDVAWGRRGTANESSVSARGLAYVMAGHTVHHLGVLRDRYGVAVG